MHRASLVFALLAFVAGGAGCGVLPPEARTPADEPSFQANRIGPAPWALVLSSGAMRGFALRIAAAKCGASVMLIQSDARSLPFKGESFAAATASLFFHHLEDDDKRRVLAQIQRVVRQRGCVVIADWHRPQSIWRRLAFLSVRLLDGLSVTRAHAQGRFPAMLDAAVWTFARHFSFRLQLEPSGYGTVSGVDVGLAYSTFANAQTAARWFA